MEMVEDAVPSTVQTEAEPTPNPPRVGSLTKVHKNAVKRGDGGRDMPEGDWNKFARDYSPKKAPVQISSYSKEEATRRKMREKERRELQDRNAKLMQQRAEEEMRRKQQEKERVIAERKAWAQAKLEQRLERISRAAEERKKRDAAYCQLLETTRERGLLFEKLHAHGEEFVAAQQRQKLEEYRSLLAPAKKVMPGTGHSRLGSSRDVSPQPRRVNKLRHPSPARTRGASVDRASSPVALPGVEITVRELPATSQAEPRRSLSHGARKESAVAQPGQEAEYQQALEERNEAIADAGEGVAAEAAAYGAVEASEPEAEAAEAFAPEAEADRAEEADPEQEATPEADEMDSSQPEEEVDNSPSAEASEPAAATDPSEPAVAADPSGELEEDAASAQPDDTTQGEDHVSGEEEGQEAES